MALTQDKQLSRFSTAELRRRAAESLTQPETRTADDAVPKIGSSDFTLNPELMHLFEPERERRKAAVLIPVLERREELTVLFTKRSDNLPTHAGQISFPGGKVDDTDSNVLQTVFREAHEEIGLESAYIEPVGFMDDYITGTDYCIAPLVAIVRDGFAIEPDPGEVDEVFEVPFSFLMDNSNHQIHSREWRGAQRLFYAMPYKDRFIWGATAGMLRSLYESLYAVEGRS